ncbi:MAG: hypothetical protein OXN27_12660 [Candidatus Poribacteria bacterium]|nr:hypothetical protein [Candidatus Poribacteria bacterium]
MLTRLISFVMVILLVVPFISIAQESLPFPESVAVPESVAAQAMRDAEIDVEKNFNAPVWFALGCFLPVVGVLSTYFMEPVVPSGRLIGKSPEYVAHYTDAYRQRMKTRQVNTAVKGCLSAGAIYGVLVVISIIASET